MTERKKAPAKPTAAERRRLQTEIRAEIKAEEAARARRLDWLKFKVAYGAASDWSTPFKPDECRLLLELFEAAP